MDVPVLFETLLTIYQDHIELVVMVNTVPLRVI